MKVNADLTATAAVHFNDITFIPSPTQGVSRGMLDRDGDEVALATTLVRYAPDASFPPHQHAAGEEFLVLEGTFKDEHGAYPAGTYVRNEIGSVHAPSIGSDGCLILVKLRWMVPEDTHVVVHDTASPSAKDWTVLATGGKSRSMYHNPATGERAWFVVLAPGARVESLAGFEGGEEVFVVAGAATAEQGATSTDLTKYSWLRLPPRDSATPSSKTVLHNSGDAEAHLFIKTGHLRRFVK